MKMTSIMTTIFLLIMGCLVFAVEDSTVKVDKKTQTKGGFFVNYKPPQLGKPDRRVGGGTRGGGRDALIFSALAPDHAALTASAKPVLCWFASKPIDTRIELIINDEAKMETLFEKALPVINSAGIYCLRTSDYNVSLRENVEYQWLVALVLDPKQRSKDVISGGSIIFKKPSGALARVLAGDYPLLDKIRNLAEEGYWYDAFELSNRDEGSTIQDKDYLNIKRQLMIQAGLKEAAEASTR